MCTFVHRVRRHDFQEVSRLRCNRGEEPPPIVELVVYRGCERNPADVPNEHELQIAEQTHAAEDGFDNAP